LPPAAVTNNHYASPEILKSLYAGMVLHNQGRYIDALPLIADSKSRKIHIDETEAWIVNCYRLAGFPEIADTVAIDKQPGQVGKQAIPTLGAQSEPGLALLGVTADAGISRGLAERLGMLLIDRLHEASGMTVLASEDIAGLRDEYDLLLGLDKVKGTTWRQAPPILLRDAVTGHLAPDKTGVRLRLCLIRNCNPTSIYDAVTSLPADHAQWRLPIDKAVSELLARRDRGSPVWSPPDVIVEEDQGRLLSQLETSFGSWIYLGHYYKPITEASPTAWIYLYLKVLTRNSDLTKYREQVPWRMGLYKWFLRVLPEGHPDRPVLEFSVASLPLAGYRQWTPGALQKSRVEFQRIAEKYPEHFIGLFSRYNLALIDMTPANYSATQEQIGRLLPKLMPFQSYNSETTQEQIGRLLPKLIPYQSSECANSIARVRRMNSALRYALGLPNGNPDDVMDCSSLITVHGVSSIALFAEGFMAQYLIPRDKFHNPDSYFLPKTPEQMRVDLDALCCMRDRGTISARFLRDIIEKNGLDSDLTRYAVLKYFKVMTYTPNSPNRQGWPEADLCVVCPVFADCLKKLLARNPQPMSESGVSMLMGSTLNKSDNPLLSGAAEKARQVFETAFPHVTVSEDQRRKSFDESWKVGPLKDSAWIDSCSGWQKKTPIIEDYYPYLQRLHELYDNEVKSHVICRFYCQFGVAFFYGKRYDLSEPLFEQIVSWRDYKNRPPDREVYAMSLYLLAWLKQRNGDTTAALRLSKDALAFMDEYPKNKYQFYNNMFYPSIPLKGVFHGTRELKPMIVAFMKKLRENPKAPFNHPFIDRP
ncbi:MAG: tetratricopeptide repeat protein, partial [Patescibacteria group bacterium]